MKNRPTVSQVDKHQSTVQVFTQIAAILLRLGIDAPNAQRLLRLAFVYAAKARAEAGSRRATQSRIATIAGISRLEVRSILGQKNKTPAQRRKGTHLPTRLEEVVEGWRKDPLFTSANGKPRILNLDGGVSSFDKLAKKYGRDVTAKTLREELVNHGLGKLRNGKIALVSAARSDHSHHSTAESDLRFAVSNLAQLDLRRGRRTYVARRVALSVPNQKAAQLLTSATLRRLEAVLSYLQAISSKNQSQKPRTKNGDRRLLVTTTIIGEALDKQ